MCFEIMLSALTDDDRSFVEKLYLEYGDYMYSVAYDVLKHKQDAEDAVNDAMCKIIKYLSKFDESANETVCNMVIICIRSIVNMSLTVIIRMQKQTILSCRTSRMKILFWKIW